MKKWIMGLGVLAAGLTPSIASAQDYCCPVQYDPCCDPCCMGVFEGFYLGGNLGVITDVADREDLDGFIQGSTGRRITDTDVTVGLQLGYDWNCGSCLWGLAFDWNWSNIDRKLEISPNTSGVSRSIREELDWYLTLRLRGGFTVCDSLFYLTVGAALADFDVKYFNTSQDSGSSLHHSDCCWGWVGGVGMECMVWCNWSLGAEVLYMHFDTDTKSFSSGANTFAFARSDSVWVGRVTLNYHFGDLFDCFCR